MIGVSDRAMEAIERRNRLIYYSFGWICTENNHRKILRRRKPAGMTKGMAEPTEAERAERSREVLVDLMPTEGRTDHDLDFLGLKSDSDKEVPCRRKKIILPRWKRA